MTGPRDFELLDVGGRVTEVHDFKGVQTAVFKVKARLFRQRYPETPLVLVTKADLPPPPPAASAL